MRGLEYFAETNFLGRMDFYDDDNGPRASFLPTRLQFQHDMQYADGTKHWAWS